MSIPRAAEPAFSLKDDKVISMVEIFATWKIFTIQFYFVSQMYVKNMHWGGTQLDPISPILQEDD